MGIAVHTVRSDANETAYGLGGTFDTYNLFEWKDIFGPGKSGKDIYKLVYAKTRVFPHNDALAEVAKQYGLTKDEAQRVVDGSILPIFNSPNRRSAILTQEDASQIMVNFQNDYADYKELFDLQREVETSVAPSEIFSNGDLSDSGFDLLHDLEIIEEILFVEKTETTVGLPFENQLDTPFIPTDRDQMQGDFVGQENAVGVVSLGLTESGAVDSDGSGNYQMQVGKSSVDVEILEADICSEEGAENGGAGGGASGGDGAGGAGDTNDGEALIDLSKGGSVDLDNKIEELVDEDGKIKAAENGVWVKAWCPGITDGDLGAYAAAGETFGDSGFSSLGGTMNSLIDQVAAATAGVNVPGFSAYATVCLETTLVKKRVSSYQPGQSCIACEIEKINQFMDKTLSHSLLPNKVTGNLMESAVCKDAFQPLVDMQFIAIAAPVETPANDDLIYGRNVVDEWNKFIDRYQPLLFSKVEDSKFVLEQAPPDTSQAEVFNEIQKIQASEQAKALREIKNFELTSSGVNTVIYTQSLLDEMKQMTRLFKSYNKIMSDINSQVCPAIKAKKDI